MPKRITILLSRTTPVESPTIYVKFSYSLLSSLRKLDIATKMIFVICYIPEQYPEIFWGHRFLKC